MSTEGVAKEKPWKLVARERRPEGSRVWVGDPSRGGVQIGGPDLCVVAGPCAVESAAQMRAAARAVAAAGARLLRGGAWKPRSSPYAFQGLGEEGLLLLAQAGREVGLPTVTEVLTAEDVPLIARHADVLQVGARNMQNFSLLKALGAAGRPVLLKRGLAATMEELLLAAEYIVVHGNPDVILCERGIRTFETATRNTLDLNAVAALKLATHLPVLVDPSHGTGRRDLIQPLSRAALAVGADGLIIEVHPEPAHALCDGPQSLTPEAFVALMRGLASLAPVTARSLPAPVPTARTVGTLRERIDSIDEALVRLLAERATVAMALGTLKSAAGLPLRAPEREAAVLGRVAGMNGGALDGPALARVFREIIAATRGAEGRVQA